MHKIKELRKSKGHSQSDLAGMLGKSLRTVQNYEGGSVTIPNDIMQKIASIYEVDVAYFYASEGLGDFVKEKEPEYSKMYSVDDFPKMLLFQIENKKKIKKRFPELWKTLVNDDVNDRLEEIIKSSGVPIEED